MRARTFLPVLVILSFLAAACGSSSSPSATQPSSMTPVTTVPATTSVPAPTSTVPVATTSVLVYFLLAEKLHVAGRQVATANPVGAVDALLAGPTAAEAAAGLVSLIPAGTELNSVDVRGNEVTVDLTGQFGSGGGSLSVSGRVAQMVYTLTQFPGIDTVRFSLDGSPVTELTGEGFNVNGLTRVTAIDLTPIVLLERPYQNETVSQPIHVSGTSNTFEATVYYEVLAANGSTLITGNLMATSGSGTWGTFDADLAALPAGTTGNVTVRLFDRSSVNGDPVDVTEALVHLG